MSEMVSIREAARRLGLSDTALRKAIEAGRMVVAGRTPGSNRPLLAWPDCQAQLKANSDGIKRTHAGTKRAGGSATGASVEPTSAQGDADGKPSAAPVGSLADAQRVRVIWAAKQAKLKFERDMGKLLDADQVKVRAFQMARKARDQLMTMPDRLAPILAGTSDVLEVHRLLTEDIERTCHQIAADAENVA